RVQRARRERRARRQRRFLAAGRRAASAPVITYIVSSRCSVGECRRGEGDGDASDDSECSERDVSGVRADRDASLAAGRRAASAPVITYIVSSRCSVGECRRGEGDGDASDDSECSERDVSGVRADRDASSLPGGVRQVRQLLLT
ncbi:hypothetical protein ACJJTC_015415, partial [Scirpophaga incertulas]